MRAPHLLRDAGLMLAALAATAAAPRRAAPPSGEVTAVSVLPAPGRVELVVDVQGTVEVSDFVLRDPARLVLDLVGARLTAPIMGYDGVNRGGVRNVRYSQFRSDVVRVVVELDEPRDYEVRNETGAVRVSLNASGGSFDAWSSDARRVRASAAAARPEPRDVTVTPVAPAAASLPAAIPAAPAQPAPPAQSQERRIDVRFDRASIHDVAAHFAEYSGRSIIVRSDLQVPITADIRNQPWDVALRAILETYGLAGIESDGIIRIDSRQNLAVSATQEPLTTRSVRINYARASSLAPAVRSVVSQADSGGVARGRVEPDTVTNSLIITDVLSRIDSVVAFVRSLDQRTPQVAIQARIIFVDRTDLEELGLRYDLGTGTTFFNRLIQRPDLVSDPTGATPFDPAQTVINLGGNGVAAIANAREQLRNGNPALELVYSTVLGNFALSAFLDALQQVSLADVEAVPSVTIADNRQSEIFSGEQTPIRVVDVASGGAAGGAATRANVRFMETGIKLQVTPHVVRDTREVLMELYVERSFVTPSAASDVGAAFATQRSQGQVLVRDGETIVIGGLTVTEVTVTKTGVPFLVDLPVIGRLFGFRSTRETRRDLIILVTPHIVDDLTTAGPGGTNR